MVERSRVERVQPAQDVESDPWTEYNKLIAQLREIERHANMVEHQKPTMPENGGSVSSSGGANSGEHKYHLGDGVEFTFGSYSGASPSHDGGRGGNNKYVTQEDFDNMLSIARTAKEAYTIALEKHKKSPEYKKSLENYQSSLTAK